MTSTVFILALTPLLVGSFFFVVTRGTLLFRNLNRTHSNSTSYIYPVYSEMWLIHLIDFQPLISLILLFQYKKLVDKIIDEIERTVLHNKKILITSCAFGDVIPRLVSASKKQKVEGVIIMDIINNELVHIKKKLGLLAKNVTFVLGDASLSNQKYSSVEINILFFLLHELPDNLKGTVIQESGKVVSPGGKLIIAEFHRPHLLPLRILSRLYFHIFEPYALSIWDNHDPLLYLKRSNEWTYKRTTYFFGNFQIIIATKKF